MIDILLNLLTLNLATSLIWGYFDAPQQITNRLVEIISRGKIKKVELKKPLSCMGCSTVWLSFIYLLFALPFNQIILICVLSATNGFLTKFSSYTIQLIDQLLSHLAILFERLINKIR